MEFLFVYLFCREKINQLKTKFQVFSKPNQTSSRQDFLTFEKEDYIGYNVNKHENVITKNMAEMTYQKFTRKSPERHFFANLESFSRN